MVLPLIAMGVGGKLLKKAAKKIGGKVLGKTKIGKALGLGGGKGGLLGGRGKRRSRGLNLNKFANRLIRAKMNAKLMKVKMSSFRGI